MFTLSNEKLKKYPLDLVIIIGLFIGSFFIALSAIKTLEAQGQQPFFYQGSFEPAVMLACGKGFVVSNNPITTLQDFLQLKTQYFSCESLPSQLSLTTHTNVRAWYYMISATAITWKIFGISWGALNKLVALLFSLTIIASYGIFRLGMGRSIAFIAALLFATSSIHQEYLLFLRDYSKAPFILTAIFVLGLLVTRPFRVQYLVLFSAALGVLAGIGYGFRPDMLIILPISIITLLFFLPDNAWRKFFRNSLLCIILICSYWLAANPALKTFTYDNNGTCTYHFTELGLSDLSTTELKILPSSYSFINQDNDSSAIFIGFSYAQRIQNAKPFNYCSKNYDKALGAVYLTTIKTFPADFIARGYSSILRILQTPFYFAQASSHYADIKNIYSIGPLLTVIVILLVAAVNLRLAIYILLLIFYFLGYPALQFLDRHYFHLTFWPIWVLGFLLWHALSTRISPNWRNLFVRLASLLIITGLILTVPLWVARCYQTRQVEHLIHAYQTAPTEIIATHMKTSADNKTVVFELTWPLKNKHPIIPSIYSILQWPIYSEILHISVGGNNCAANLLTPTLHYATNNPSWDFSDTLRSISFTNGVKNGDIYIPVYFSSLDSYYQYPESLILPIAQKNCIQKIERITSQNFYPLWITLTLPSDWQKQKLYQQITF